LIGLKYKFYGSSASMTRKFSFSVGENWPIMTTVDVIMSPHQALFFNLEGLK